MTSLPAFFVRLAGLLGATVAVLAMAVAAMGTMPMQDSSRATQFASSGKP